MAKSRRNWTAVWSRMGGQLAPSPGFSSLSGPYWKNPSATEKRTRSLASGRKSISQKEKAVKHLIDRIAEHKGVVDAAAVGTLLASLADWLPAVATIFTIIWTVIRIAETKTFIAFAYMVKKMFTRRKKR